jgi:hypothetical protein
MPSDIIGTDVIEEDRATGRRNIRFIPGPVFAQGDSRRRDQPHAAEDTGGDARGDAGISAVNGVRRRRTSARRSRSCPPPIGASMPRRIASPMSSGSCGARSLASRATIVRRPMRSGWWLLPFAAGLAAEWWQRRRRGLR